MPILLRSFLGEPNTPDLVKRRCLYQFMSIQEQHLVLGMTHFDEFFISSCQEQLLQLLCLIFAFCKFIPIALFDNTILVYSKSTSNKFEP
jgi:hypothetical protein